MLSNVALKQKLLFKHLAAKITTYEASVKDGSYEQEEDALIEQLVTAVIASQQRALLTQGRRQLCALFPLILAIRRLCCWKLFAPGD